MKLLMSLRGTASPGTISIIAHDGINEESFSVETDEFGNWTASFNQVDITTGSWGGLYQYDSFGNRTESPWNLHNPLLIASLWQEVVEGFHWPAYSDVTLTIDDPNVEGEVNYTETHTVDKQGQTTFLVENPKPFIIAAGQELTLSGGGYTKSHTIFDIGFSSYDSALETVSGSGTQD